jgi:hypothetical protein
MHLYIRKPIVSIMPLVLLCQKNYILRYVPLDLLDAQYSNIGKNAAPRIFHLLKFCGSYSKLEFYNKINSV